MSQEPTLFNCSIEENIAYGLDGKASEEEVEKAAVSLNYSLIIFTKSFIKVNLIFNSVLLIVD